MIIEKDPYIEEAVKELEKLERDPNRMDEYLFRQKNLSDYATQMKFSKELGKTEGRAEMCIRDSLCPVSIKCFVRRYPPLQSSITI